MSHITYYVICLARELRTLFYSICIEEALEIAVYRMIQQGSVCTPLWSLLASSHLAFILCVNWTYMRGCSNIIDLLDFPDASTEFDTVPDLITLAAPDWQPRPLTRTFRELHKPAHRRYSWPSSSSQSEPNFLATTTFHTTWILKRGSSGCMQFMVSSKAYWERGSSGMCASWSITETNQTRRNEYMTAWGWCYSYRRRTPN